MILTLKFSLLFNTSLIFLYFTIVEAVPEDYCLSPLNTSDCGRPPTPVFYYYKPGSRCEIKLWRGCPTENLFNTEYHCSHHCIGKLWSSEQYPKAEISKTAIINTLYGLKYRCDVPIDTSKCKQGKEFVYTYDNVKKKCTEVTYYGCPTDNKFTEEEECQEICEESEEQWQKAIKSMDEEELNELNDLLDVVKNEVGPNKEDLKNNVINPKIRPNTVSDNEKVTDLPGDKTDEPDAPTDNPEGPTDKPELPTDNPEKTTEEEQNETKGETEAAVATTNSAQETTAVAEDATTTPPVSSKRTRRKRGTKKPQEGDVVREGVVHDYQ